MLFYSLFPLPPQSQLERNCNETLQSISKPSAYVIRFYGCTGQWRQVLRQSRWTMREAFKSGRCFLLAFVLARKGKVTAAIKLWTSLIAAINAIVFSRKCCPDLTTQCERAKLTRLRKHGDWFSVYSAILTSNSKTRS